MDTPFQLLGALSPERKTLGLRSNKRGAIGGWGKVNGEREEYGES